jgi:hypothetical protein
MRGHALLGMISVPGVSIAFISLKISFVFGELLGGARRKETSP